MEFELCYIKKITIAESICDQELATICFSPNIQAANSKMHIMIGTQHEASNFSSKSKVT